MIYLFLAVAVPLVVASLVAQATQASWLVAAACGFLTLLVLAFVGGVFSYDCFNADCGGRDDVAGWGFYVASAGLVGCGLLGLARVAQRRWKRST